MNRSIVLLCVLFLAGSGYAQGPAGYISTFTADEDGWYHRDESGTVPTIPIWAQDPADGNNGYIQGHEFDQTWDGFGVPAPDPGDPTAVPPIPPVVGAPILQYGNRKGCAISMDIRGTVAGYREGLIFYFWRVDDMGTPEDDSDDQGRQLLAPVVAYDWGAGWSNATQSYDGVQIGDGQTWTKALLAPYWTATPSIDLYGSPPANYWKQWGGLHAGMTEQENMDWIMEDIDGILIYHAGIECQIDNIGFVEPGDANGDGVVNVGDLAILAGNWQTSPAAGQAWGLADFNLSGLVDVGDLALLAGNWGDNYQDANPGGGGGSVPEPMTLTLLGIGGLALIRKRK